MVIVTISWQLGIDGERVSALLGERLAVPVVDGEVVDAVMEALRTGRADAADMERFVPTWSANVAVSLLATAGMPAARADVIRAECAHTAVEAVIREAAKHSCVVMGRGGFAILADHPGACHVRLTAPADWRAARLAACECLPAERAERKIEADDRNRAAFVRHYHHRRIDDPANFHLLLAAERFRPDELAEVIATAATHRVAKPGTPVPVAVSQTG
ncbi:MAG TPA: cytidylate kinase-like family protein [Gaiellales bacterium]|nr:cytidylate kinase-like family protein [Gaiellales bacterium]